MGAARVALLSLAFNHRRADYSTVIEIGFDTTGG
jgi:hypothetical protein